MRVLFVGEGPHDIGRGGTSHAEPGQAAGVVPALARRVLPDLAADSLALRFCDLPRFSPGPGGRGFAGKVAAAILISQRRYGLAGTICVADRDRDRQRLPAMQEGRTRGLAAVAVPHAVVCAVAVESIEAWTLGARQALGQELAIPAPELARRLPADVEALSESSGKPERRPKRLLSELAEAAHRQDCSDLRTRIAEATDVQELSQACREGFAPFVRELRAAFAP